MTQEEGDGSDGDDRERLREAHVVFVAPVLDPAAGGRGLLTAMALRPAVGRLDVCGFAPGDRAPGALEEAGIGVRILGAGPSARPRRAARRLRRYLRKAGADVVHLRPASLSLDALDVARRAKVPVRVAEEAGVPPHGRAGRHLYRRATDVVALSGSVAEALVGGGAAPAAKVTTIPGMVAGHYFGGRRRPAGTGQVLSVGRLVPGKGHDVLLEAVAPILRGSRIARLRIAGAGPAERDLVMQARQLGIGGQVELLGARSDVAELLATADLFVLPSREEGFAAALVEAMAMRVPVVATSVGGVPEVLGEVAPDALVPPEDPDALGVAVARALALGTRSCELFGDRLHDRASDFTAERHAEALVRLYAAALQRSSL